MNRAGRVRPVAMRSKGQGSPAAGGPLLENPGERLLEELDAVAKKQAVRRALNSLCLRPRDRRILEGRFGIGCEEQTFEALAREFDVSAQFIQHRLQVTLSLLREDQGKAGRWLLQAHRPADAMGSVHEARLRNSQHRELFDPPRQVPRPRLQLTHPVMPGCSTDACLSK